MKGSSVLASAVLAAVLVFGGLWALDNTAVGLRIKCQVFNDVGACFVAALIQPTSPTTNDYVVDDDLYVAPPTESPEERAAREAAEAQERRDAVVRDASAALGSAIDDLTAHADELATTAEDMPAAVRDVEESVDTGMSEAYGSLKDATEVRPMDDYAQLDVCYALNEVEYARNDVDYSVNGFEYAEGPYTTALDDHADYVVAVEAAMADLAAAEAANPDGIVTGSSTAPYTVEDGQAGLDDAEDAAKKTGAKASSARADIETLVASADEWMAKAQRLAAKFASC